MPAEALVRLPRSPPTLESGETMATVRIANAPVSFGVFELTAWRPDLPPAEELMAFIVAGGYEGVDLGPIGYLGERSDIAGRLARHGLGLCGGWVEMRLSDDAAFEADLVVLDQALDIFAAAAGVDQRWRPRPTLADAGSPRRAASVGQAHSCPELALDDAGWDRLTVNLQRATDRCRDRGLDPTFHQHAGTYVETTQEVERMLEATDVGLCLDTGHLLLGGGDPVTAWRAWAQRINHVHLKDARLDVLDAAIRDGADMDEVWRRGVFCPLGAGDLDVDGILTALGESDFTGWIVVEQDTVPLNGTSLRDLVRDQHANRDYLRVRGW